MWLQLRAGRTLVQRRFDHLLTSQLLQSPLARDLGILFLRLFRRELVDEVLENATLFGRLTR